VRSVAGTLSDFTEVVLAGRTATESNFKREAAKGPDVIHLALHAFADKSYPDRAGLVFAADDSGEDGVLQVREIRRLPLAHTSLVTLSACDTSAGRVEGEEGVSSIVSAFLYAGSRTALSSFWSIEDSSTSELMKLFYGSLARGNSKSAALRSAQLELLRRGGETKSPFFWAAFGLLGDGSGTIEDRTSR
jgi:CHAT domain-containing protein